MPDFDQLTADDLRAGDVLLEDGEVTGTVERTTKVPSTGEIIIVTTNTNDRKYRGVHDETDAMPGWVRGSQWEAHLDDLKKAEADAQAAEEAASAGDGELEVDDDAGS